MTLATVYHRLMLVCLLVGFATPPIFAADQPVSVKAAITPTSRKAQYTITVNMDIEEGWHTYDDTGPDGVSVRTTLKLELPDGISTVGDWNRPLSLPSAESQDITIYEGSIEFTRAIQVNPAAEQDEVALKVRFQACTDKICQRPKTVSFALRIPAKPAQDGKANHFAAPVRLLADGKLLNSVARRSYPSPAIYDVDQDGQVELVVGDISGTMGVYEQTGTSKNGDPIWAPRVALKTADGQPVRVSNW